MMVSGYFGCSMCIPGTKMKIKLGRMAIGNERIRIMKEPITSSDGKINSPISTRLEHFPFFVISEAYRSWCKEI